MSFTEQLLAFLYAAILASVPLLYGTLGEILIEKAGNLNLGVEGMMYLGAIMGFLGGFITGNPAERKEKRPSTRRSPAARSPIIFAPAEIPHSKRFPLCCPNG